MSLPPPIKVGKLQTALHTKAKNSPGYRFYALYDKLYRRDILKWAFLRCLQNGGAPGVYGQSFADIETYGQDRWLDELTEELRNETYRPRPVRRVLIPKGDGKLMLWTGSAPVNGFQGRRVRLSFKPKPLPSREGAPGGPDRASGFPFPL